MSAREPRGDGRRAASGRFVAVVVGAFVLGLGAGGAVGWVSSDDGTGQTATAGSASIVRPARVGTADDDQNALGGALSKGVRKASVTFPGEIESAIWRDGWQAPVVRGSGDEPSVVRRSGRRTSPAWATGSVVAAIAVLRSSPAGGEGAKREEIITEALSRPGPCSQRRIVRELEDLTGGTAPAARAIADVLGDAGGGSLRGLQPAPGSRSRPDCPGSSARDDHDRTSSTLSLYGAEWSSATAAGLARSLATERLGGAGRRTLRALAAPSAQRGVPGFTPDPVWGAGRAFPRDSRATYVSGYDVDATGRFSATQIVVFRGSTPSQRYGIAVTYSPNTVSGRAATPQAVEAVLSPVAKKLSEFSR